MRFNTSCNFHFSELTSVKQINPYNNQWHTKLNINFAIQIV